MINAELPRWLDWGITLILIASVVFFFWLMKPTLLHSEWKEQFIQNKTALALILLSLLAFLFMLLMGWWADAFFPVETYR